MEYLVYLSAFFALFAMLARRDLPLALALFAGLLPAYLVRFPFGPLPSTALEGMAVILFVVWAWRRGRNRQAWGQWLANSRRTLFFWPGVLLLVAAFIASFISDDVRGALGIWRAYFLEPFLVYLLAVDVLQDRRSWQRVFIALGCTSIALTLFAVFQFFTGEYLPTWEWTVAATRRATAVYTSPNALALFVVPVAMLFLPQALGRPWTRAHRFYVMVVGAAVVSLAVSLSKGGMAAFAAAAVFVLWQAWSKKYASYAAVGLLAALLILPATRQTLGTYVRFENPSGQSRLSLYQGSLQLLKQSPVMGIGLDNFGSAFETVRPAEYTEKLIYPHNIALNFWLETGLAGLLAVAWIVITSVRAFLGRKPQDRAVAVGVTASLLAMLVHGLIDVPYFKNDLAMLAWLALAAFAWQYRMETHRNEAAGA